MNSVLIVGLALFLVTASVISVHAQQDIQSPLKQFKSGKLATDVSCENGYQLIIKIEDGSPACVTQYTFSKLILRHWGFEPNHKHVTVSGIIQHLISECAPTTLQAKGCPYYNLIIIRTLDNKLYAISNEDFPYKQLENKQVVLTGILDTSNKTGLRFISGDLNVTGYHLVNNTNNVYPQQASS